MHNYKKKTNTQTMKREYKLILIVIAIAIAYCIGIWIPIDYLKPQFKEEELGKGEYFRLIISIISAFITFTAVLVALFKDDLREYWKYARLNFSIPVNTTIEITNDNGDTQSDELHGIDRFRDLDRPRKHHPRPL